MLTATKAEFRRPLIIVENGVPKLQPKHLEKIGLGEWTWEDLVKNGLVEYLDAEEEENAYIALTFDQIQPDNTHVEIATYTILRNMRLHNPVSRT